MKRRDLLKGIAWSSLLSGSVFVGRAHAAGTPVQKKLVVLFQRGGSDGINTIIPYGDDEYYQIRPTIHMRKPPGLEPGEVGAGLDVAASLSQWRTIGLQNSAYFGFHPGLEPWLKHFDKNYDPLGKQYLVGNENNRSSINLAVLQSVQYETSSTSHFYAESHIEGAAKLENGRIVEPEDGWLYRYLNTTGSNDTDSPLRAMALDAEPIFSLKGSDYLVSTANSLQKFNLNGVVNGYTLQDMESLYDGVPDIDHVNQNASFAFGHKTLQDQLALRGLRITNRSSYYGSTKAFAKRLYEIAQLLKYDDTVQVVALDTAGLHWDTHLEQRSNVKGYGQSASLESLASVVDRFFTDLGYNRASPPTMDVTMLVCTEFGRTATENDNEGTDHGVGATWFVLGRNVNSGLYVTEDPNDGFPTYKLVPDRYRDDEGNIIPGKRFYMPHAIDYRDIYGDILRSVLDYSGSLDEILPNHTYNSLNIFA